MLPGTAKRHHPTSCAWHPTVGSVRPCPGQKGCPVCSDLFSAPIICIHVLNGLLCSEHFAAAARQTPCRSGPACGGFASPLSTCAGSMTEASPPRGSPPRMRSEPGMIASDYRWGLESLTAPRLPHPQIGRAEVQLLQQPPTQSAHTHTHTQARRPSMAGDFATGRAHLIPSSASPREQWLVPCPISAIGPEMRGVD